MDTATDALIDAMLERLYTVALAVPLAILLLLVSAAIIPYAHAQGTPDIGRTLAACGKDLTAALTESQTRAVAGKAEAVVNGEGIFWKIEKAGIEPSHLLGTIHLPDPRVTNLAAPVVEAIDSADRTVLEIAEIADPEAMAAAMFAKPDIIMLQDGDTLKSLLGEEQYGALSRKLEERGMPIATLDKLQPWFIGMSLAMPNCAALAMDDPTKALDSLLAQRAQAAGQEVLGLETVEEQLKAVSSLSMTDQIEQLVTTADYLDEMNDIMETMVGLYGAERIAAIMPTLEAIFPDAKALVGGSQSYAAFEDAVVDQRNVLMTERMIPMLEDGNSFVAVGALHLIGETGIVAGLRERGWIVSRVDLGG